MCYVEMEMEYVVWRWMSSVSRGDGGGAKEFHRPPHHALLCEADGGSINLAGYLSVGLLGENGNDTSAMGALYSWIVERGMPLSIPRVEKRMGMGLGIAWRTASLCER